MPRFELARDDLEIAPRTIDGETVYFVGDPIKIEYHRLDELQYLLFQRLDGKTSLEDLSKWLADTHGVEAPPEALGEFVETLRSLNLLDLSTDTRIDTERGKEIAAKVKRALAQDGVVFGRRGGRAQDSGGLPERRTRHEEAKLFDLALDHLDRGEISRCGARLREVLRKQPANARARYLLRALFSETLGKVRDSDSILWWRIPIGNPDRLLGRIDKLIGRVVFTKPMLVAVGLVFLLGCGVLLSDIDRFIVDLKRFFEFKWIFQDPLLPVLVWTLGPLQLFLHECAHGVSCRHFGGRVREMGILIARLSATAYCDISATYLLENKWQRALTCYAGILIDAVVWTVFVLIYHVAEPSSNIGTLALISIPIKLESMISGTNPLLRGDGYFALTELVNYPNLADDARGWVRGRSLELVTGEPQELPDGGAQHARMFWIYTVGSAVVYAMVVAPVMLGIIGYLVARLQSLGVLLSVALLYLSFGGLVRRTLAAAWRGRGVLRRSKRAQRFVGGALALGVLVLSIPLPLTIEAPCRVRPDVQWLRAPFTGAVADVAVAAGAPVKAGAPLVTLDGSSLRVQAMRARSELEQAQLDEKTLQGGARKEEVGVTRAALSAAAADLGAASREVAAARARAKAGGGRETLDAALAAQAAAQTRYATAEKALTLVGSGAADEALNAARARVEGLRAQVADAEAQLAKAAIASPVNGVVVAADFPLRELPGRRVGVGEQILGVRRNGGDVLEIHVSAVEPISVLAVGEEVKARLLGMPDSAVVTHVTGIGAAMEKATGDDRLQGSMLLRVEAPLPDDLQGMLLPSELSGTVRIAGARSPLFMHLWLRAVRLYELDILPLF